MNRERLKILRDHLASLPDERFDMRDWRAERKCGTVACIGGWACALWGGDEQRYSYRFAIKQLGLEEGQGESLFFPQRLDDYTRTDAIAAIDSMLANPDDDALPVWPEREEKANA